LRAKYKAQIFEISTDLYDELSIIEHNLLKIGASSSRTSYYNYLLSYHGELFLIGWGEKNIWNEMVNIVSNR
ncbi:MAG: hypothetical protein MK105_15210, partial [Crocinitomicaceae bacterium]|nr:hypothetical protein [Crocinitomicaceae bacterium]